MQQIQTSGNGLDKKPGGDAGGRIFTLVFLIFFIIGVVGTSVFAGAAYDQYRARSIAFAIALAIGGFLISFGPIIMFIVAPLCDSRPPRA